jgi:RNA polymerase sigma factor (sigma-70 family)
VEERVDADDGLRDDVPRPAPPRRAGESAPSGTEVVRQHLGSTPAELRVDFGAHLEANYQRLVAQLYAITLDPGEAHDVVQEAYSRAWRTWAGIGRMPDPSAWIRRVAVRSTIRSWRRMFARRPRAIAAGVDPRTRAVLAALGRLSPAERRAVVLHHMAGASLEEIAAVEQVHVALIEARLARGRLVVTEGMADVLPDVLGSEAVSADSAPYDNDAYGPTGGDYARDYGSETDGQEAGGREGGGERR